MEPYSMKMQIVHYHFTQIQKNLNKNKKISQEQQTSQIIKEKTVTIWMISEEYEKNHNNSIELYIVHNKLKKNLLFPFNLFPNKDNNNAQEYMSKSMK